MGDDISDENLSCKPNVIIPKLNGLSMIKTGHLKETLVHKNGYIHQNGIKISSSGSQVMFVNSAVYVEKSTAPKSYSQGDRNYKKIDKFHLDSDSVEDGKLLKNKNLTKKPLNHINGVVCNGAGDRLSSPVRWTNICEPRKISSDKIQNNDEDLTDNLPSSKDSQSSSFCSISGEECSSTGSSSEDGIRNDTKVIDSYIEKPPIDDRRLTVEEEIVEPVNSLQRLLYRSYSNVDKGKASPVANKTSSRVTENNLSSPCSAVAVPRRSARLTNSSYISTFPEKVIRKKILNALAEKGDVNYITIECKGLLPHNWENLISYDDLTWFRWYISKLEQDKQRREIKKNIQIQLREEEEKEREQRLHKYQLYEENLQAWIERKKKEDAARREKEKLLELEKQKEALKREKIEKASIKSRIEWNKRKESEKKEQQLKKVQERQQKEQEERIRAQKNKEAFETWRKMAKNRPKPMSVAIKDHKGRSDPALARLYWNPNPWRNILEESKNVPKDPGKKKKLTKPCST
ncbi:hypothetical protein L9F63_021550 [Diploptera punctata]|uniref:Coiled-coil domain-containing protein n=1 Tax=Diploptera punctata TaxID=6984 RepID=A0AAD8EBU1_DIPPU|nr:hypothetical protein L9F63_021550 [Diploptera punctata]